MGVQVGGEWGTGGPDVDITGRLVRMPLPQTCSLPAKCFAVVGSEEAGQQGLTPRRPARPLPAVSKVSRPGAPSFSHYVAHPLQSQAHFVLYELHPKSPGGVAGAEVQACDVGGGNLSMAPPSNAQLGSSDAWLQSKAPA